jgi:hypothetical protein
MERRSIAAPGSRGGMRPDQPALGAADGWHPEEEPQVRCQSEAARMSDPLAIAEQEIGA